MCASCRCTLYIEYYVARTVLFVLVQVIYLNAFYTSVVLILPLVVVFTLNVLLIRTLQESRRRIRRISLGYYEGRSESNITIVMIAIIIELLLCHTPDRVLQVKLIILYR